MLEGLVASFLTRLLGEYVKDIDADRLNVNLGAGHVQLHDLELRRDAVYNVFPDAPCVLHSGRIGRIAITIPWSALGSAPAVVVIDRVDVILLPLACATPDDLTARASVDKRRRLARPAVVNDDQSSGFMQRLVTGLVNNVQLSIGALHVRYVDAVSDRAAPVVLGAVLAQLGVHSTDAAWQPQFVSADVPQLFKLARLDSFGLYCDALPRGFSLAALAAEPPPPEHAWILEPVSGTAKATLSQQADVDVSLSVAFAAVDVRLSFAQYRALFVAFEAAERERRSRAHRHERPTGAHVPRAWWRYLTRAVTRQTRERRERARWPFMRRFIDARRVYEPVWQKASLLSLDALDSIERECLDTIENEWPVDDLLVFRALAEAQLARQPAVAAALREAHDATQRTATWSGWATSFFVAPTASTTTATTTAAATTSLTDADIDRLCATIGVSRRDSAAPLVAQRRVLATDLGRASLVLVRDGAQLLEASMSGCTTKLLLVDGGMQLDADVVAVSVVDNTVRNSAFPQLLTSADDAAGAAPDNDATLVGLSCRLGTLAGPDADLRVVVRLKPLRCVVHAPLLRSLVSFFDVSERLDLAFVQAMEQDAVQRWSAWSAQAADNLARALEQSRRVVLAVDLHAPTLTIPLEPERADSPALLLDLGRLCVANDAADVDRSDDGDDIDERLYRAFRVSVSRARVGMVGDVLPADLIAPFDVSLRALVRRSRQAPLPRLVVSGQLPVLRIAFSAARSVLIIRILRGVFDVSPPVRSFAAVARASIDEVATPRASAVVVDRVRVNVRVKQVFVALTHAGGRALLNVQLHHASIGVLARPAELVVRVQLQHLDVVDLWQQCGDDLLVLASSRRPSADDASPWRLDELGDAADDNMLIDFVYTQRRQQQHIAIQLGLLLLQWNANTMDAVLSTWRSMFPPPPPAERTPSPAHAAAPPTQTLVEARARRVAVCVNNDSELWAASAERTDRRVLLLLFADMQTRVAGGAGGATTTTGGLRSLLALDLTSPRRSPVLVVDSATVVDFEYVMHSGAADDTLRVNMHSLRFVHWRARTDALIAMYFYVLARLGSAPSPPPLAAAAAAEARVVRFAFSFDRPVIVMPLERDAVDGDALLLDLGVIRATNRRAEVPADVVLTPFHNAAPENRRTDRCHLHCSDDAALFRQLDVADEQVLVAPLHEQYVRAPPTTCERTAFVFTAMRIVGRVGGAEMLIVPNVNVALDWDVRMAAPLPEQAFRVDVSDIVIALDERRTGLLADCMARNMARLSTERVPAVAAPPPLPSVHGDARAARQLACFLSKFEIDLLAPGGGAPLFAITLANWRMLTVVERSGAMFSTFELAAIAIEDCDDGVRRHAALTRHLLGATDAAFRSAERSADAPAQSCHLSLQWVRFADGEMTALGLLDKARIVIVAGRGEALLAALTPKTQQLLAAYGQWAAAGAAAAVVPAAGAAAAAAQQRYVLDVRSPNVYVVHDGDEQCAALRLTATWFGSAEFCGVDSRFSWRVRDASASRCSLLDAAAAHASVVAPFGYRLTWASERATGLRIAAKIDQVAVMLSYRDIKLLYGTAQRFRSGAAPAAAAAEAPVPAAQDLSVELAGASVMLVNDCADANDPLLLIQVDSASLMAQNWASHDALAFLALQIALDNYDVESQQWMSLLEPWAVQLKWQRKLELPVQLPSPVDSLHASSESTADEAVIDELLYEDDAGTPVEPFEIEDFELRSRRRRVVGSGAQLSDAYTVFSDQPLNVNVTQQFVHTATTLAQTWTSDFYAASSVSGVDELFRAYAHSYLVANHTGVDLALLQEADELVRIARDDHAPRAVEGLRVPLRFDARSRESVGAATSLLLCGTFAPMRNVPLDAIGVRWARPAPDDPDAVVVCQTEAHRGGRLLTVRSNVVFANATEVELRARAVDGAGRLVCELGTLAPDARLALPVGLAHRCRVQLRPVAASLASLGWSSSVIDCARLDDTKLQRLVRWEAADDGTALPFVLRFSVEHNKSVSMSTGARLLRSTHPRPLGGGGGGGGAFQDYCVVLRPPLRIANGLPLPLTYSVRRQDSPVSLMSGVVASGGDVGVAVSSAAAGRGAPLTVAFLVSGFEWTEPVPLAQAESEQTLLMRDAVLRTLPVTLASYLNHKSVRKLSLCCKFWIVNNTGLPLLVRDGDETHRIAAGQVQVGTLGDRVEPFVAAGFIDAPPLPYGASVMRVRVADSSWSAPVRLESIGAAGACVDTSTPRQDRLFSVVLTTHSIAGALFHATTAIVVSPRHMVHNATSRALLLRQRGTGEFRAVLANESTPWHWPVRHAEPLLELSVLDEEGDGVDWLWSGALSLAALESSCVRIAGTRRDSGEHVAVHLEFDVSAVGATSVLTLTPASAAYPQFRVVNRSALTLEVQQRDDARALRLLPGQTAPFAWHEPAAPPERRVMLVSVERSARMVAVQPSHLHTRQVLVKARGGGRRDGVVVETHADGPTRTVLVRRSDDFDWWRAAGDDNDADDGAAAAAVGALRSVSSVQVSLNAIGVSLIDNTPVEFAFARLNDISVKVTSMGELEVLVGDLRVDNQLLGTPFPALFRPHKSDETFAHISVVLDMQQLASLDWCKYAAIRIGEFHVLLEIAWLVKALTFLVDELLPSAAASGVGSFEVPRLFDAAVAAVPRRAARRTYVRTLHINPVRMYVSYLSGDAAGLDKERREQLERRLGRLSRLPASNLSNVENAQVTLNMLLLEHGFARRADFVQRVLGHYRAQAVDQLYTLLFSADILGQPLSLVQSLGTGVHDFFHEPAKGFVRSPGEFGRGLERGVESLVKNSVYGFANSFHKAAGAIGTGVALLSLDARYQRERQVNRVRELPQDVGDGLLLAAKDLSMGILGGLSGIFVEPIRGARDEGIGGFGKGVLRGVLGVAVKPTVGLFDAASRATEGVRNSAQARRVWPRMRAPRIFDDAGDMVRPYDRARDTGRFYCRLLGAAPSSYVWHCETTLERALLLHGARLTHLFVGTTLEEADALWSVDTRHITELHVRPSARAEHRDVLVVVARGSSETVQFASRATMTAAMSQISARIDTALDVKRKTFSP